MAGESRHLGCTARQAPGRATPAAPGRGCWKASRERTVAGLHTTAAISGNHTKVRSREAVHRVQQLRARAHLQRGAVGGAGRKAPPLRRESGGGAWSCRRHGGDPGVADVCIRRPILGPRAQTAPVPRLQQGHHPLEHRVGQRRDLELLLGLQCAGNCDQQRGGRVQAERGPARPSPPPRRLPGACLGHHDGRLTGPSQSGSRRLVPLYPVLVRRRWRARHGAATCTALRSSAAAPARLLPRIEPGITGARILTGGSRPMHEHTDLPFAPCGTWRRRHRNARAGGLRNRRQGARSLQVLPILCKLCKRRPAPGPQSIADHAAAAERHAAAQHMVPHRPEANPAGHLLASRSQRSRSSSWRSASRFYGRALPRPAPPFKLPRPSSTARGCSSSQ